jgi:predicted transcriptional regulator YdeE
MSIEQLSNVRIVRLPAMTVASYCAESKNPEKDCHDLIGKFVLKHQLHKKIGFRHFGFNNPSPTEDNPVYGYEIWVTVPDDFDIPKPLSRKRIESTLYASIPTQLNEIGERWQNLAKWVENSDKYIMDSNFQWLEECIDFETFYSTFGNDDIQQLDLLEPIKVK